MNIIQHFITIKCGVTLSFFLSLRGKEVTILVWCDWQNEMTTCIHYYIIDWPHKYNKYIKLQSTIDLIRSTLLSIPNTLDHFLINPLVKCDSIDLWIKMILDTILGVLLEYPTTTGFQWGHLKNGPYTYTVSGGNGRVF